ncbi:hypothetical protein SKAU_G00118200 [Synaphobranchus kaupii]|uniref:Uncharacterized protein n=1 Tax=Synaphobranchus kaupii TaxID=118154 RepID=A0A9Q1J156_SYNKA|nr:hypothetical protein SKAU_G00118200 [Synaphobranchus kaupii]
MSPLKKQAHLACPSQNAVRSSHVNYEHSDSLRLWELGEGWEVSAVGVVRDNRAGVTGSSPEALVRPTDGGPRPQHYRQLPRPAGQLGRLWTAGLAVSGD